MIKRTLKEIEKMVSGHGLHEKYDDVMVNGVSINSRTIQQGNLFIPIIGEKFNGHEFVEQVMNDGAACALWQEDMLNPPENIPLIFVKDTLKALQQLASQYRSELSVKVIGITGSNGKTTTKDMTAAIFQTAFNIHKTEGNFNNHIGLPLTILQLAEDTEVAIIEMGMSSRGEIELLSKIAKPDIAIITNIGESHLQDLGSREEIAEAKLEILAGLAPNGSIIYHGDEPLLKNRLNDQDIKKISFGQSKENNYYPVSIRQENNGTYFKIEQTDLELFIPVLGKHNVYNALAAIAAARAFEIPFSQMKKGLETVALTSMRMELMEGKNGVTIINDAYNASPTSMKAAIQLLADMQGYNRKLVVLGDMLELGENEVLFHQEIGRFLDPSKIDVVYTYGNLGEQIAVGVKSAFPNQVVKSFIDKHKLIEDISLNLKSGDLVLVKGSRGMKLEEVVQALKE